MNLPNCLVANQFERQQSMDSNEQIQNMDLLLNSIDKNTRLKIRLEKVIIEFNKSPNKAFTMLWKDQIVFSCIIIDWEGT